ncbi:hypothetical protein ACGFSB_36110 [Streptomyces sp. NPDC048441]|uniref:hypothetical protein n=1 Tax=Streptomyces sp. NPDC048441 TaxID=3365552 RepID=UPI003719D856
MHVLDAHVALAFLLLLDVLPAPTLLLDGGGLAHAVLDRVVHHHREDAEDLAPVAFTDVRLLVDPHLPGPVRRGLDVADCDVSPAGLDVQADHRPDGLLAKVPNVLSVRPRSAVVPHEDRAVALRDVPVVADVRLAVQAVFDGRVAAVEAALTVEDPATGFVLLAGVPPDSPLVAALLGVRHPSPPRMIVRT